MIRLLCTDLDRTLLPNGAEREPDGARERLAAYLADASIRIAYVTGRDEGRVREAIDSWDLPTPDFVMADVGSSFLIPDGDRWTLEETWSDHQRAGWGGRDGQAVQDCLGQVRALTVQPADRQTPFKRSFTVALDTDLAALKRTIEDCLSDCDLRVAALFSHDPLTGERLLDLVSPLATKRGAVLRLAAHLQLEPHELVFAGDSGNDVDALVAGFPSILVGNADDETRRQARAGVRDAAREALLYEASAPYAAGILEGMEHYRAVYSPDA